MSQIETTEGIVAETPSPAGSRRISFERLRERTDELELLISGLLAFALLTVPAHLFDAWAGNEIHVDGIFGYALQFAFTVAVGLCYSLGFAFVTHLAIRGYWVGLVGLKSSFPAGIQWDRLPLMGQVSRAFYRHLIGDLGVVIDRIDRTASTLFAMTILIALTIVWTGMLGLLLLVIAALVGMFFEDSEKASLICFGVLNVGFLGIGIGIYVLDKAVSRREARGRPTQGLQRVVRGLIRVFTTLVPQRLIAPVQFTLQSNLGSRGFMAVYFVVLIFALLIGGVQIINSVKFSLLNRYQVITTEAVDEGMLSAQYESMRGPNDVMLQFPMIPSDRISERQLRLFIPHRPRRDNPLARQACAALDQGRNEAKGTAAASAASACLARIWTVTLDGAPIRIADFVPMERRDLGMRGLVGYIDLSGKSPGRHDLRLIWNAGGGDRGMLRQREYLIPFWYGPEAN
ncbi:MAG TPA: hypothetical protein VEP93_01195 [Variovorax sp.]|nr:hypothetical protein [Variovorax sp.]